jgi:hypothetical protein
MFRFCELHLARYGSSRAAGLFSGGGTGWSAASGGRVALRFYSHHIAAPFNAVAHPLSATADAFPARSPIGVLAASSARFFPVFSSTALPPSSVTAGAASSAVALTVGVEAAPPAVAASRWVAVLVAKSVSLGPGGLRLVLAPLHARSSAVSTSTAAWSPWTARRLPSAAGSWVQDPVGLGFGRAWAWLFVWRLSSGRGAAR